MTLRENHLALACRQAEDAAGRLAHWVQANGEKIGSASASLARELEARRAAARLLARSASRPAVVGVVGPGAAAKAHVVGGLARPEVGRITAQFAGLPYGVDYLAYVAPGEEGRGLGVAVRLSPRPRPTPPGFPIPVRLLSVADVARILASIRLGEIVEGGDAMVDRGAVQTLCRKAAEETAPYPIPGLTTRDIQETRDHLESYFGDDPILRTLATTPYWDVLAKAAPRLSEAMRAEMLSQLWPGLPELTQLFRDLVDALGRLGHSAEAFVPLESVVALDRVAGAVGRTRGGLLEAICQLNGESFAGDLVVVSGQKGHKPAIPRAALAAIVAEARFTLAEPPGAGLAESEIVEFPCLADPRQMLAAMRGGAEGDARQLFLRCKSLYQLQRSAREREVTSLVVCVDERPVDLGRFPEALAEWVELVHGTSPGEREAVDAGLFIALVRSEAGSKESLPEIAGRGADWSERASRALFDSLNVLTDWPREWTPGRAFDNIFILRGAAASRDDIRLLSAEPLAPALDAVAPSPPISNHVGTAVRTAPPRLGREPTDAGDDGTSYLAHSVASVSNSFTRHRQISQALARMRAACSDRLRRLNAGEDIFSHREARHRAALIAVARLMRIADAGRFGHVVKALQVPSSELAGLFADLRPGENAAAKGPWAGGGDAQQSGAELPTDPAAERAARAAAYAEATVRFWIASMRALALNPRRGWELGVPQAVLTSVIDELIDASERTRLVDSIAKSLGLVLLKGLEPRGEALAASVPAADAVAAFVKWLGYHDVAGEKRPRRRDKERTPVFPPRRMSAPSLLWSPAADADGKYHSDWCQAYVAMVADNVSALFEKRTLGEAERRLGDLMRILESNSTEAQP